MVLCRYLTKQTGGNIHDNGTIEITANSVNGNNYPKNLVDYQNQSTFYQSNGINNEMVCFDFKNRSIQLTNYSMKAYNGGSSKCGYNCNQICRHFFYIYY